jgi:hypothetical protein
MKHVKCIKCGKKVSGEGLFSEVAEAGGMKREGTGFKCVSCYDEGTFGSKPGKEEKKKKSWNRDDRETA